MTSWSLIKSRDAAQSCCESGLLVKTLLFPQKFGGTEVVENTTYIPPQVLTKKEQLEIEILNLFKKGLINLISVRPEYRGDSFVPARIYLSAWRDDTPKVYDFVIDVW